AARPVPDGVAGAGLLHGPGRQRRAVAAGRRRRVRGDQLHLPRPGRSGVGAGAGSHRPGPVRRGAARCRTGRVGAAAL
ncbi:MAG: hypothetical protein AVDCRST_MAG41-1437, partial [uncultured Corynebacteriales bacterium]